MKTIKNIIAYVSVFTILAVAGSTLYSCTSEIASDPLVQDAWNDAVIAAENYEQTKEEYKAVKNIQKNLK